MAHDFYIIDSKVEEIGRAFGLDEIGLDKDVDELSGGQRTRSSSENFFLRSRISCSSTSRQTIWMYSISSG